MKRQGRADRLESAAVSLLLPLPLTAFPGATLPASIPVLYEDNHLLVVNKPAGLATMGAQPGEPSVHRSLCEYLKRKYQKPGKVYLGVVQRLDRVTSGVLVLARTSKAAARLSDQFRQVAVDLASPPFGGGEATQPGGSDQGAGGSDRGAASKTYLAVVQTAAAAPLPPTATLTDWVAKNDRRHRMEVVGPQQPGPQQPGAQQAVLDYRRWDWQTVGLTGRLPAAAVALEVRLRTGRKHQIRVQFASRGCPVWGDTKYGARPRGGQAAPGNAIALHAWQLRIVHPTIKQPMVFTAPVPRMWSSWFPELVPTDAHR